ncbi:hypothetical protein HDU96_010313 [Phlyctochytrium bullatum]|nr:hypothetical protein HDU96_010313 [Phlyctochytrium bullatum]
MHTVDVLGLSLPLFLLLSLLAPSHAAFTTPTQHTYSAVLLSGNLVQLTIQGPLDAGNYVALGVPLQEADPEMETADLYVAYAAGDGSVRVLEGAGRTASGAKGFRAAETPSVVVNSELSAASGTTNFTAVFTRPVTGPNGVAIADAPMAFLWAVGRMSGNAPVRHSNRGVVSGVNIVGGGATAAAATTTAGATTTAAGASTTSGVATTTLMASTTAGGLGTNRTGGAAVGGVDGKGWWVWVVAVAAGALLG